MEIQQNVNLKPYNTFGIMATASYFATANWDTDLPEILNNPQLKEQPLLVLGGGSNMLLTQNFNGLVLHVDIPGTLIVDETDDYAIVRVGAGVGWHSFVLWCIDKGLGGLENLSLIPGNVGAAPMQNIGAYGVEIKDTFESLTAYNIATQQTEIFTNTQCQFGYRESYFKRAGKGKYIITYVTFKLSKKPKLNTAYGAIEDQLGVMGIPRERWTIKEVSDAVIAIRQSKLPNPAEIGNAGSFFKNPVVSTDLFSKLKAQFADMPAYPAPNGVKLAAGWLIEQCGLKGYRVNDAGVHAKQALVLVNYGNAKGNELFDLSTHVLKAVKDKFGVDLEREVNII